MFYGETTLAVDDKGRIALPTAYREQLRALCDCELVVAHNPWDVQTLWLMPKPYWERKRDELSVLHSNDSMSKAGNRMMLRRVVGAAVHLTLDSAGRMTIPPIARQVAAIERQSVLVGLGDYFELWNDVLYKSSLLQPLTEADVTDEIRTLGTHVPAESQH